MQAVKRAKLAGAWLQDRLPELRDQSSAVEHAIVDFKAKNNIVAADGQLMNEQQVVRARIVNSSRLAGARQRPVHVSTESRSSFTPTFQASLLLPRFPIH